MSQQITLTVASISNDISNSATFSLTVSSGTVTPNTCTKADLVSGLIVEVSDDTVNAITVISTSGVCSGIASDTVEWTLVSSTPTPTPVPATATPTPAPATATPTPAPATATPSPTPTSGPGATATPTPTPTVGTATATPTPTTVTVTPATATPTPTPTTAIPATATPTPTPTTGVSCTCHEFLEEGPSDVVVTITDCNGVTKDITVVSGAVQTYYCLQSYIDPGSGTTTITNLGTPCTSNSDCESSSAFGTPTPTPTNGAAATPTPTGTLSLTTWYRSTGGLDINTECCEITNTAIYFNPNPGLSGPQIGDIAYTDSAGTSLFNGGGFNYAVMDFNGVEGEYGVTINSSGVVTGTTSCICGGGGGGS